MTESKPTNPKDAVGIKKCPLSVVPAPVIMEAALGMMEGALKYGRHNYRVIGVRSSVYYDATIRHLMAWWEGQNSDPESGLPHLAKAISSLIVLRDSEMRGNMTDDRPPKSHSEWIDDLNKHAADLIKKYPEPKEAYTENNHE